MLDSSSTIRILLIWLINLLRLEAMIPGLVERAQLAAALDPQESPRVASIRAGFPWGPPGHGS